MRHRRLEAKHQLMSLSRFMRSQGKIRRALKAEVKAKLSMRWRAMAKTRRMK